MATDEIAHPGSVFRMQFNYVHGQNGGNAVKSRAERNEIYYNRIEGAPFHLLELIGPDPAGGAAAGLAREDSDVVGNLLVQDASSFYFVRAGGDGTGASAGRYRFVNNTFVRTAAGPGSAVFRMFSDVESIEMSNNVFFNTDATAPVLFRANAAEVVWTTGAAQVAGQNNWVEAGATSLPPGWTGTISGSDPGFRRLSALNLRPGLLSPLRDSGTAAPAGPPGFPFPSPLFPPAHEPVRRDLSRAALRPRVADPPIDIGAYERERRRDRRP